MTTDPAAILSELDGVGAAIAGGSGAADVYRGVETALARLIGHRLFTLLAVLPGGEEVQRFWSSDPAAYPLTGRKRVGPTPWGERVLAGRQSYLGRNAGDIRWAFADHELIASLGLGSVINVPVIQYGTVLGTMNLLHAEGHYDEGSLAVASRFAPLLVAPFHAEFQASRPA